MNQERDKRSKKDLIYNEEDNRRRSGSKAGKFIRPEKKVETAVEEQIKTILRSLRNCSSQARS